VALRQEGSLCAIAVVLKLHNSPTLAAGVECDLRYFVRADATKADVGMTFEGMVELKVRLCMHHSTPRAQHMHTHSTAKQTHAHTHTAQHTHSTAQQMHTRAQRSATAALFNMVSLLVLVASCLMCLCWHDWAGTVIQVLLC
jgi:hypothetical protein